MKTTTLALALLLLATPTALAADLAPAPAAGETLDCAGPVCDAICDVYWALGQECPVRLA